MKRNFFTAALESNVSGTVGVDAIHVDQDLQPKPGVGTDDDVPSEDKPKKEFGEDHPFAKADEIDTVAESQEHTLALEHLQSAAMKYCRMAAALEEIAETAEVNLTEGVTMEPSAVAMVTTAIDAAGIGEPMEQAVALESFDFSAKVATEGFVDALKDRSKKVWAAAAKFAKKAWEVTTQKLKRFADFFRSLPSTYAKLEKEGEILNSYGSKAFQNAKWEKSVQDGLCAPSSTKTVLAAAANALAEFDEVNKLVNGRVATEMAGMKGAWRTEKAESVVAQMNKLLTAVRPLAETGHTRFKHASTMIEVNLPERVSTSSTGGLESTSVTYEKADHGFSAGIKTATMADIKTLKTSADRAANAMNAAWSPYVQSAYNQDQDADMAAFFIGMDRGSFSDESRDTARKLLVKYTNLLRLVNDLVNSAVFATADGAYTNHYVATRWIRFSIAEAKAAARGA